MTLGKQSTGKAQRLAAQAEQMERDLAAIQRVLRRPLETQIAANQVTAPQIALMREVVARPGMSLKQLSRALSLAHSTVSGIVDRVEKRGMIDRRPDPVDGRVSRIFPAAAVTQFVRRQIPALARRPLRRALERASTQETEAIASALRRLRELLEKT
jgi:MarR family transcriptional regulator, organic hydroperoxide resistance regulator